MVYEVDKNGVQTGSFTQFTNGRVSFVQSFDDILDQHSFNRIVNHIQGERMEIYSQESGQRLYHGEFNEDREREGWGIQYDEKSGAILLEGIWKRNKLVEIVRKIEGSIMTEFKRNGNNIIASNRIPVYVGEYIYDEEKESFIRNGRGYYIDEETRIAYREVEWKDGVEVGGRDLYDGWYTCSAKPKPKPKYVWKPQPVAKPVTIPVVKPVTIPVVEPVSVPISPSSVDPVVDPVSVPINPSSVDPVVEPIIKPISPSSVDPVVEPVAKHAVKGNSFDKPSHKPQRVKKTESKSKSLSKSIPRPPKPGNTIVEPLSTSDLIVKPAAKSKPSISKEDEAGYEKLKKLTLHISDLVVPTNYYVKISVLDLSLFDWLESIEIGDDCFGSVKTFKIDGLNQLKMIKIGNNSFTQNKNDYGNDQSKSFHILNCESLESIEIGEYSFSDFAGEFELKNLPQLQSIQIGTIGSKSNNFYSSSFVIRGIEMILNIVMNRSSKSTIHYIR